MPPGSTQPGYRRMDWIAYWLFKWLAVNPIFRILYRGRVYGVEQVPTSGPVIVVSNHGSHLDPPLISNALCRPVAYMAKAELFEVPVLKQAIRLYGAYPVKRGGADRGAIQATEAALRQGWAVGIFLNGTRTPDGRIPDPHLGAALISARTGIPLLPVALWGTYQIWPKGQKAPHPFGAITVHIGELIPPPPSTKRADLEVTTQACVAGIHRLLERGR